MVQASSPVLLLRQRDRDWPPPALQEQASRVRALHYRPAQGRGRDLLQAQAGDRGHGPGDQVRHDPRVLQGLAFKKLLGGARELTGGKIAQLGRV